jgi:Predicted metal binding domain
LVEAHRQVTDPRVSRAKFEREIREFRRLAGIYRERGWFLAEATFPVVVAVLAAHQVKPSSLVLGVRFDYADYDFRPPSVQIVDPFTAVPYATRDLPTNLPRAVPGAPVQIAGVPEGFPVTRVAQPLLQSYGPEEVPFLCIPGVREYHDHPGHSGDAWELHRRSGAGRLVRLLEVIDRYGTAPITGYNVQLQVKITGFQAAEAPE